MKFANLTNDKMNDIKEHISELDSRFEGIRKTFDLEIKKEKLKSLAVASTEPDLWNDQDKARSLMQELGDIKKEVEAFEDLQKNISALIDLSKDESFASELTQEAKRIGKNLDEFELKTYLSGEYDAKNAILSIHAGQGGTEAMDWVSMLYRMYLRFCERRGWDAKTLDISQGDEAGIKSVTLQISESFAYGYLKGEAGTHRLVRQSPFNADNLRQTSFALVEVMPELKEVDLPNVEINDEDLEWQFFRSSSQGGQNVQKVSTAVRLIHIPTGLTVTAQSERFQEQNRKIALNLLRSKLWVRAKENEKATREMIKGEYRPASWGTQIRSYVLHPYKMVKDLRTQVESSNPDAVLDGELNEFVEAELKSAI